jgi:hypothetical protein
MSNETYKALIESVIEERAKELGLTDRSEAFESIVNSLVLDSYDLSVDEIDSGITEGGGDGQIDAMYVLANSVLLNSVEGCAGRCPMTSAELRRGRGEEVIHRLRNLPLGCVFNVSDRRSKAGGLPCQS